MSDELRAYRSEPTPENLIRLLRSQQDHIFRLCFHVLRRSHDAEDAAQEVLLRIASGARTFDDPIGFHRWVYRVCLNSALESLRKATRRRAHEERAAMTEPPQPLDDESRLLLFEGMAKLDDRARSLLLDHYFEGATLESLAAREGVSGQAMSKRVEKAREDLRRGLPASLAGIAGFDLHRLFPPAPPSPDLVSGPALAGAASTAALAAAGGTVMALKSPMVVAVALTAVVFLAAGTGLGIALQGRAGRGQELRIEDLERQLAKKPREVEAPQPAPAPKASTVAATEQPVVPPLTARLNRWKAWKLAKKAELDDIRGKLSAESLSNHRSKLRREEVTELEGLYELANADPGTFLAFMRAAENEEYLEGFIHLALGFSRLQPGFIMLHGASFTAFSEELSKGLFELAKSGSPVQRAEALAYFGRLTDVPPEYSDYFRGLIYDPEPKVQAAAISVLTSAKPLAGESLKALIDLGVKSGDDGVRRRIAESLRYVDEPEAASYLFERLENPRDSREFITVVNALGHKIMIAARGGGKPVSEELFLNAVAARWSDGHDENSFRVILFNILCCRGPQVRPTLAGALNAAPTTAIKDMVAEMLRRLEEGEKDHEALRALIYKKP